MFEESHFCEAFSKEIELKSLTCGGLQTVLDSIYTGEYLQGADFWVCSLQMVVNTCSLKLIFVNFFQVLLC